MALPKPIMDFAAVSQCQRTFFQTGATRSVEFRGAQLEWLAGALERHEARLLAALHADLRKSPMQGYTTEIGLVQAEIRHAQKHLARWAAPQRRRTPWLVAPGRGWVQSEPFGVALILGPWNYPVQLLAGPLALLRGKPAPLALYVFTRDRATERRVLADARSGGACVNDVVSHMIGAGLPFGGLGESGMGAYHGRAGFDTFSHQRAVLRRATWLDLPFRYPPQKLSLAGLKRAMRFLLGD